MEERALGQVLLTARESKGLSILDVAAMVGIDPGNLSRYERGLIVPRLATLNRLADFYGLPEDDADQLWLTAQLARHRARSEGETADEARMGR